MLQAGSSGQEVVGDVEYVVGLMVGQMDLEQAERGVDRLVQAELLDEQMDSPDAAVGGRPGAIGEFVVDVRGGQDGLLAAAVVVLVQASQDSPLAFLDLPSYLGTHSKTSVRRGKGLVCVLLKPPKTPKVFESFHPPAHAIRSEFAWL